ncbi:hypothetical protein B0T20DRAFT_317664, partial [Sordaria brevicollis]
NGTYMPPDTGSQIWCDLCEVYIKDEWCFIVHERRCRRHKVLAAERYGRALRPGAER